MEPTCVTYEELKKKWAPHIVQHDRWRGYTGKLSAKVRHENLDQAAREVRKIEAEMNDHVSVAGSRNPQSAAAA